MVIVIPGKINTVPNEKNNVVQQAVPYHSVKTQSKLTPLYQAVGSFLHSWGLMMALIKM